jgi:hypothetical protein
MTELLTPASIANGFIDLLRVTLRGYPATEPYYQALDAAVKRAFSGVACQTYHACGMHMATETKWWRDGTDHAPLSTYKARQVRAFVIGWMAGHQEAKKGDVIKFAPRFTAATGSTPPADSEPAPPPAPPDSQP